MPEVRKSLMRADLVLPSLDAGDSDSFQSINRPHEGIAFERMVEGIATFTRDFPGDVWLEIFMLAGVNDSDSSIAKLTELARHIAPARVQLNTVTRPPAEGFAHALPLERVQKLLGAFPGFVEIICEHERENGSAKPTPRIEDSDILSLLGRRPCTPEDIAVGLGIHPLETLKHLDRLMAAGKVGITLTRGRGYYTLTNPEEGVKP
jgi:wyosine [tRNA(Phe)-imidazoG37] synthetase (radical SAM superfamily)